MFTISASLYLAAFICKLRYRVPLVYDIQDFWPDTLVATGMFHSQFGLKIIDANCRLFYKAANKIVVLSPGFKKKLIQKGVPEHKIEIVYNWFDEKNLTAKCNHIELPEIMTHKEYFKILFAGNMGKAQALDSVLQAAALLKEKSSKIQFIFIGGGVEVDHLKKHVQENNLFNVHFLPPQPFEKIGPILDAADVLLVHLKKEPLFEITIPSKIQAYLAAGKPILSAVAGDASDLIVNAKAGLTCPSEDSSRLAERALEFSRMTPAQLEEMGRNGQNYYKKKLSMQVGIERFDRIFNELG
jgi:glycosyltransferase involved in cell wall biosynthesis